MITYRGHTYREAWTPPPFEDVWADLIIGGDRYQDTEEQYDYLLGTVEYAVQINRISEDEAWQRAKDKARKVYDTAVRRALGNELNGKDCYRVMELDVPKDQARHYVSTLDQLGKYWSTDPWNAIDSYEGPTGAPTRVWFRARIDMQNVNREEMFWANAHVFMGPTESEVTFKYGSPIFVYAYWLGEWEGDRPPQNRDDRWWVDINDWRWA